MFIEVLHGVYGLDGRSGIDHVILVCGVLHKQVHKGVSVMVDEVVQSEARLGKQDDLLSASELQGRKKRYDDTCLRSAHRRYSG